MKKLIVTLSVLLSTLTVSQAQTYIYGSVRPTTGQNNTQDMTVWLIKKCPVGSSYTLTAIDSADVADSIHAFSFVNPQVTGNCQLLIKAAFKPGSSAYSNYLPTYYASNPSGVGNVSWSGATAVTANNTHWNFTMVQGTNPGGPGFVGGSVLQGANKGTAVNDPLEGRTLLLTDMNDKAIGYTSTDAKGEFKFDNLPFGEYKLFGDRWGKNNPALVVKIDGNKPSVTNIEFRENSSKFEGRFVTTSIANTNTNLPQVTVYPNPIQGQIQVNGLQSITGDKKVTLRSITGATIYSNTFTEGQQVKIETNHIAKGLYLLQVETKQGDATFKLTK